MPKCSNCGGEVEEGYNFCKFCGAKLAKRSLSETTIGASIEADVKNAITRRLDGIKSRDENVVRTLFDKNYNKFDDWPPFTRQEYGEALKNELGAFKVLSGYNYEIKDFEAYIYEDVALATFHIHYQAEMRNRRFEVASRVTSVLIRSNDGWKVVHEHFSRFPEAKRRGFFR